MGTFIAYMTLSDKDLKRNAKDAIRDINKWFEDNPKRKDCNAELWYGKRILIPKGKVKVMVEKFLKESLTDKKTIRTKRTAL